MTQKHFEAIAAALRKAKASYSVCLSVAAALDGIEPRFQRYRFLEACGVWPQAT